MQLRCVCLNLKFMDLLSVARHGRMTTVEELSQATGCGTRCGSCRPLLEELLRDNQVTLNGVVIPYPRIEAGRAEDLSGPKNAD
jgi:bacterioferritin-associated ferredoxin